MVTETVHKIDPKAPSVATFKPGELFTLSLKNAFGHSFATIEEFERFLDDRELKTRLNHPCTGPIEIETDQKQISLAITIVDISATRGYQCISKSTGFLKEKFSNRQCVIYDPTLS